MKDEVLELYANRMLENAATTNKLAVAVERLTDAVRSAEGKVETRELAYKDDLLQVRREHTKALIDLTAEIREFKGDAKDALGLRAGEKKDHPVVAGLKVVANTATTKFLLVLIILVLFSLVAIANGWIKMK